jgi:hypothetical protein
MLANQDKFAGVRDASDGTFCSVTNPCWMGWVTVGRGWVLSWLNGPYRKKRLSSDVAYAIIKETRKTRCRRG